MQGEKEMNLTDDTYRMKGVDTYRVKGVDAYRVKGVDTYTVLEGWAY